MDGGVLIAAIALGIQMVLVLASAAKLIGRLNTRAESHFARFDMAISHLTKAVERVGTVADRLDDRLDDHAQRLVVIEQDLSRRAEETRRRDAGGQ